MTRHLISIAECARLIAKLDAAHRDRALAKYSPTERRAIVAELEKLGIEVAP